ncbi:hypothetical protein [Streptococcus gordonii]|uniref:Uncharacterized protein n=1 Tax=Streptococcus gordonii TaxID=1302 RepID=A0AAW3H7C4_STRGN|nr:hypothetical protein [Streptococcus gordonii]KJQ59125.1 hypothetical protein TZ86_00971 [Streptococcus gordonii]
MKQLQNNSQLLLLSLFIVYVLSYVLKDAGLLQIELPLRLEWAVVFYLTLAAILDKKIRHKRKASCKSNIGSKLRDRKGKS